MDVVRTLHRLGGVASRRTLVLSVGRREFDAAVRRGEVLRDGYGRYALPVADTAVREASRLGGVVSHRSAALHWGWELKSPPSQPDITVRRNRVVAADRRAGVVCTVAT